MLHPEGKVFYSSATLLQHTAIELFGSSNYNYSAPFTKLQIIVCRVWQKCRHTYRLKYVCLHYLQIMDKT